MAKKTLRLRTSKIIPRIAYTYSNEPIRVVRYMEQRHFLVIEIFKNGSDTDRKKAVQKKIDLHIKNKLRAAKINKKPALEKNAQTL